MIERKLIDNKAREHTIKENIIASLNNIEHSNINIIRTPLGVKIVIYTSKPGLVVGRGGETIKALTKDLIEKFGVESPQIEVVEIENPDLDPQIIAQRIVNQFNNFGIKRFKAMGHGAVKKAMDAGAQGIEIKISGRVPSKRARYWRFYRGFVPKSGEPSQTEVKKGFKSASMKIGAVGVTVKVLGPDSRMPDDVIIREVIVEEEVKVEAVKEEKPKKKKVKKKTVKKTVKKEEKKDGANKKE